jgi:hypothetical protein
MSVQYSDFAGEIAIAALIFRWAPTLNAELTAISTALAADVTTHDTTIETRAAALKIGPAQTALTNRMLLAVNKGKGGNLANSSMISAIDGVAGVLAPPANTSVPFVSGTGAVGQVLSCTTGIWVGTPTSYAYQWLRDGTNIAAAIASTYTLVAADSGHNIACVVTATNPTGSTAAPPSNAVHCA